MAQAENKTKNPERSFGVSVGAVLCAIAAVLLWRGRIGRGEIVGGVGVLLLVCGLAYPPILRYPSAAWWRFSRGLGYVNARVLLTILFWIVLVPLSLIWKVTGTDPLTRRRAAWPGWQPYPPRYRDSRHYERMY
ncbi:MAG TPA: SxtJ family membrane protein [Vicinamibacterales bacterium]|nr:SxtJ family membrane protein [Vicinamibacterales bacterium]